MQSWQKFGGVLFGSVCNTLAVSTREESDGRNIEVAVGFLSYSHCFVYFRKWYKNSLYFAVFNYLVHVWAIYCLVNFVTWFVTDCVIKKWHFMTHTDDDGGPERGNTVISLRMMAICFKCAKPVYFGALRYCVARFYCTGCRCNSYMCQILQSIVLH